MSGDVLELRPKRSEYDCPEFLPHADKPGCCDGCGEPLTGRQRRWCRGSCQDDWRRQHDWGSSRNAAKRRDGNQCVRDGCGSTRDLEVNHIEPRVGRGYGWGCHNHLTNLETLCHRHHLEVTAQQRAARRPVDDRLALFAAPPEPQDQP